MKSRKLTEGIRAVVLEMRTIFTIFGRKSEEEGAVREIIDKEAFDICHAYATQKPTTFAIFKSLRLIEYWMSKQEIAMFCEETMAFVGEMAAQHPSLTGIPVAVHFEVCTIQLAAQPYDATKARAIVPRRLNPLYLSFCQSVVRKAINLDLAEFLTLLPRVRVECRDQGSELMLACPLCSGRPRIGDQITNLYCGCVFHSHCIVQKLGNNNLCPLCWEPSYDSQWLRFPYYWSDPE